MQTNGYKNKFCYYKQCTRQVTLIILTILSIGIYSCKKLVASPPTTDIVTESGVYSVDATAIAVLTGIYSSMNTFGPIQGTVGISLLAGLSSDELTLYSGVTASRNWAYYQNNLSAINGTGTDHWNPLYSYIFKCNAAIEGLNSSIANSMTPKIRTQLLGETKILRAFFYFYLVNLFGDVPLALNTDPEINTRLPRTSKVFVYQQIIKDLLEAEEYLNENFQDGALLNKTTERVRPTKWAAKALLARVYLYTSDWVNAEAKASELISNTGLFELKPLNEVFLKNSKEAIWQLQPTSINFNTAESQTMVLPSTGPNSINNPVFLSNQLLGSFEPNDLRLKYKNWVDTLSVAGTFYRFSYKYKFNLKDTTIVASTGTKNMKEYFMLLRLGEQYLIRAEARAQQGRMSESLSDLNAIRKRAGLPDVTTTNQMALLALILHERQVELFTEWGHRWLDLKRTGKVEEVMAKVTPLKANGAPWQSYQQLYPLPLSELQRAPNLEQNDNY